MYDIFVMNFQNRMGKDLFRYGIPRHAKETRYFGTHLETIRRCVAKAKTEYVWVVSSICDYTVFDFHWKPAPWEAKQIHCWASHTQKFGDTFLIPVEEFKKQEPLEKLEWFEDVHYHYPGVQRHDLPITTTNDVIQAANDVHHYYTVIEHGESENAPPIYPPYPNLWEKRAVYPLNKSGSLMAVPRDCKGKISKQIYDYPYISYDLDDHVRDTPQDIVFISYDEKNADKNYELLFDKFDDGYSMSRSLQRVTGVKGMVNALKKAAEVSTTSHFFAVFGKTEVHEDFDFSFQPDMLSEPKNYIFAAYNPVLDYSYGHGAVVMYNTNLVLYATEWGLDFTTSFPVEYVPIVSCINRINETPYEAWRTAFRESIKLHIQLEEQDNVETEYRLHLWRTANNAENYQWVNRGAEDGIQFMYDGGNLMDTYSWEWCKERFVTKYGEDGLESP